MIGSQGSLTPRNTSPAPFPVQAAQPRPSKTGPRPPQYIDINTTEDAVNNVLAQGAQASDARMNLKSTDKAGFSRGAGARAAAERMSAQQAASAADAAAQIRMQDSQANAKMRLDYESDMERRAAAERMSEHARDQADWRQSFSDSQNNATLQMVRQAAMLNLMESLMR